MLGKVSAIVGGLFVLLLIVLLLSGKQVELKFARPVTAIANATTVVVQAEGPNGMKLFTASVEQNGQTQVVEEDKLLSSKKVRPN